MNLTTPKIAVMNSLSDWPLIPNRENNSGAYAVLYVCENQYSDERNDSRTGDGICSRPLSENLS
jgi:hypothetical protein